MLLDDIIDLAVDNRQSIAVLLRMCIVLAHHLKNERLKEWANKELNGYGNDEDVELPDYRTTPARAVGILNGAWGLQWKNWPIPPAVLEERHRHFATEARLTQAITAYEKLVNAADAQSTITMDWPASLIRYYQQRIPNNKRMILDHAHQEIPKPSLVEMIDTVRTRVLNMALDIKSEIGGTDADLNAMTPQAAKNVDQAITNYFDGGTFRSPQSTQA